MKFSNTLKSNGNHSIKKTSTDPIYTVDLKKNNLCPVAFVLVDHLESRIKGRTHTLFGRSTSEHNGGICVFVDHMVGYIHIEHQRWTFNL